MIYRKNLPGWLEEFIYKDLGGSYEPDRNAFQNNLFSDEEKNRKYLGTYFPRSFSESYCIFSNLFDNAAYVETLKAKESLAILSFGCGTGGDLMGLLEAIAEKLPWVKNLEVVAYDGNFNAVSILKTIVDHPCNKARFNILPDYAPVPIEKPEDFVMYCDLIHKSFDFIMSFKMVNELYRHNIIASKPYMHFIEALASKLTETGILLLLDVPLKEKGVWLSLLLSRGLRDYLRVHDEYEAIVPIPCHFKGRECNERCYLYKIFSGDKFTTEKVTYCMLARTDFAKSVCHGIRRGNYVVNDDHEYCKMVTGVNDKDAYNIKIS